MQKGIRLAWRPSKEELKSKKRDRFREEEVFYYILGGSTLAEGF
jgi:hypothetical protein